MSFNLFILTWAMVKVITYKYLTNLLEKYGCKLLTTEEQFNLPDQKVKKINITSKCGHTSNDITISQFIKYKKHVYCKDCIGTITQETCMSCKNIFDYEENKYYCTIKCSNTKILSDETKSKIKNSLIDRNKDKPKKIKIKKGYCKVSYDDLLKLFESKGCQIITSREDYEILKGEYKKITIKARCGHIIENCYIHQFKNRGTGINCNACIKEQVKISAKTNAKDTNGNVKANKIEYESYKIIKSLISASFDIERTFEGCLVDILIKPNHITNDQWLPIQLKSTDTTRNNIYSFRLHNEYSKMLLLLHSITDNKFWCIDGSSVTDLSKISIGLINSKYNTYKISSHDLCNKLLEFYDKFNLVTKESANIPIGKRKITEYEYTKLREEKITFIEFDYPEMQSQCFDFQINQYKIQEKVGSQCNHNHISFSIRKRNGTKDGKQCTDIPYNIKDNDFYWFHMPDKKQFFIIPAQILYNHGFLADDKQTGKTSIHLYYDKTDKPRKTDWAQEYKFSYENPDQEKLLNMFK